MDKNILTNRFCGVFVCALMLFVAQAFADVWDGSATQQATKEGDYYIIDTEAKLAWYAKNYSKGNAKLTADLDMGGKLWTPIAAGDGGPKFANIFDGNNHRVSNIYIDAQAFLNKKTHADSAMAQNLGFIAALTGTVKNLILENITVIGYGSGFLKGNVNTEEKPLSIGTVVGWQSNNNSLVEGCYVTGTVITSGDGQAVGGVVGNLGGGTIRNCVSYASIEANGKAYVGGIAGYTKSFEKGKDTISSCVYAGNNLSSTGSGAVGGVVGYQYKGDVTISDVYYDSDLKTKDGKDVSGVGKKNGGTVNGSSKTDMNSVISSESELNDDLIVCALNGKDEDGKCKTEPWEMGATALLLNGYGADGYKIIFNANGGEFSQGTFTAVKYVAFGNTINDDGIEPPTIETDFVFAGWALDAKALIPEALGSASKPTTVYAVWNPLYTITFSAGEGRFPEPDKETSHQVKIESGKRIAVQGFDRPTYYFSENGVKYNFMGWADASDPKHVYVEEGIDNLPVATGDMGLVATWTEADVYTVSYYTKGTTTAAYVSTVYDNEYATELTVGMMDPNPGYTFKGWFEDPKFGGSAFDFKQKIIANVDLYAKWEKDSYDITYVLNGSDAVNNPENAVKYTVDGMDLYAPSWDDAHVFEGWFTDSELKNQVTKIAAGTTGAVTLYAKWKTVAYTIKYLAGAYGIGAILPETKKHGASIKLKGDGIFTRKGHAQDGWSLKDGGDKDYSLSVSYSKDADLTLYPHWVKDLVVTHYGAVTVFEYSDKTVAEIDGEYTGTDAVEIEKDVHVDQVVLHRTFDIGKMSTIMLPFSIDTSKVKGGKIYRFKRVDENGEKWNVKIGRIYTEQVGANTPYMFMPSATEMTFEGGVTLNTTTDPVEELTSNTWEYKGTYSYKKFGDDLELGNLYGFAAQARDGAKVGQFVKLGGGATAYPMRAYLANHQTKALLKSVNQSLNSASWNLPNEINVEIVDEHDNVIATGKLDSLTGEIRMDRWFDLNGRKLNAKPTTRGTYYHNGKREVIK